MRSKKIAAFILGITILSNVSFGATKLTDEELAKKLADNINFIKQKYYGVLTNEQILEYSLKGITSNLDPYTQYFTKDEAQDLMNDLNGSYVGIGVVISKTDKYIEITKVFPNSPAIEVGLTVGDKIYEIDSYTLDGLTIEQASNLIRGKEGSKVNVKVIRKDGSQVAKSITRREIKIDTVETKIINDVGILTINQFNQGTSQEVNTALVGFDKSEIKKLVIDLRDNPGGLLSEVVDIANKFVPKGPVVYINYKSGQSEVYKSDLAQTKYRLAVLVNGNSASASEILTGSIKDTKAGTIIGTKTYGKGCVQELYKQNDGTLMKITVAEYTTPSKKRIQEVGIEPDIYINKLPYLKGDKKYSINSKGTEVKNAEEVLTALGYNVGQVDETFDVNTKKAIAKYQKDKKVGSYGELDLTTQKLLNTDSLKTDIQLNKAIEVLEK